MISVEVNPMVELWCRKYAPTSFKKGDWLGNEDIRANFEHKKQHEYINMAFVGDSGLGKSLAADIIANRDFPGSHRVFNMSSSEGKVANVEPAVLDFCRSGSINSPRKLLIFQEADGTSAAAQKFLRVPMEEYAEKIVIIITCNYGSKVIDALHSRGCTIYFKLAPIKDLYTFGKRIIDGEGMGISPDQLSGIVRQARGKFRNVANLIQGWTTGKAVYYVSRTGLKGRISNFIKYLKAENLDKMVEEIDGMLTEIDDRSVCLAIAEHVKESGFPQYVKARMMISCNDVMQDLITGGGGDVYTSFWSMCAEFLITKQNYKEMVA